MARARKRAASITTTTTTTHHHHHHPARSRSPCADSGTRRWNLPSISAVPCCVRHLLSLHPTKLDMYVRGLASSCEARKRQGCRRVYIHCVQLSVPMAVFVLISPATHPQPVCAVPAHPAIPTPPRRASPSPPPHPHTHKNSRTQKWTCTNNCQLGFCLLYINYT